MSLLIANLSQSVKASCGVGGKVVKSGDWKGPLSECKPRRSPWIAQSDADMFVLCSDFTEVSVGMD